MRGLGEAWASKSPPVPAAARRFPARRAHGDSGVGPVGVVVIDAVRPLLTIRASCLTPSRLTSAVGRVAAMQHAAFPEQTPVTEHLELRVALALADFVIHAHLGGKFFRIPMNVHQQLAVGMCSQAVGEGCPPMESVWPSTDLFACASPQPCRALLTSSWLIGNTCAASSTPVVSVSTVTNPKV